MSNLFHTIFTLQAWEENGSKAQQFYEDDQGRIHSELNDWVPQSQRTDSMLLCFFSKIQRVL